MDHHLVLLAIDILNSNEHLGRSDWTLYQDQIESYGSNSAFDRIYRRTSQEAIYLAEGYKRNQKYENKRCGQFYEITDNTGCVFSPFKCTNSKGHTTQHWATNDEGERVNW